jgi:Na+/melibiose symporter-like transporter
LDATRHQVRQRPPLRALALAAVLVLAGVLLLMMADLLNRQPALTALGVTGVVLGLILFLAAWLLARSMRVEVVLDTDGYRLAGPGRPEEGTWAEVARVTRSERGITLYRKNGTRLQLMVSRGGVADLDSLGRDIAARLDANRGYSQN